MLLSCRHSLSRLIGERGELKCQTKFIHSIQRQGRAPTPIKCSVHINARRNRRTFFEAQRTRHLVRNWERNDEEDDHCRLAGGCRWLGVCALWRHQQARLPHEPQDRRVPLPLIKRHAILDLPACASTVAAPSRCSVHPGGPRVASQVDAKLRSSPAHPHKPGIVRAFLRLGRTEAKKLALGY